VQFDAINAEKQLGLAVASILKKRLLLLAKINAVNAIPISLPGCQAKNKWQR
jgi:hypothetical protein